MIITECKLIENNLAGENHLAKESDRSEYYFHYVNETNWIEEIDEKSSSFVLLCLFALTFFELIPCYWMFEELFVFFLRFRRKKKDLCSRDATFRRNIAQCFYFRKLFPGKKFNYYNTLQRYRDLAWKETKRDLSRSAVDSVGHSMLIISTCWHGPLQSWCVLSIIFIKMLKHAKLGLQNALNCTEHISW